MSGFAIFSVLGYMSQKQGIDIATVAESGLENFFLVFAVKMQLITLYVCRPWSRVHSLSSSGDPSACASGLGCLLLYYDYFVGD